MAQGAPKSPHEDFIMAAIIFGLLFGIGFAIWHFYHEQLTALICIIREGEMWVLELLHGKDFTVTLTAQQVPDFPGPQNVAGWREALSKASARDVTTSHLLASTYIAVPAMRPIFATLLGLIALWVMFFGPNTHYRRRMDLNTLIKEQARAFPTIAPFINFNPADLPFRVVGQAVPANLPLFAEALSPEEWIAFNEIELRNNQIDANRTYEALAKQLGDRWQGPLQLPIHAQGLYAAFALRHARKRKDSEDLLGELALCWTPEKGLQVPSKLARKITKIIKDPKLGGNLQKYTDKHAYTTTALLRGLNRAREEGGVLAPASFLWLRGEDRNLWYSLNNLGRRSYHAEAVGALVHYTNELIAGQKIPTPRFDDVIKGIQDMVTGVQGRPIPPLDKNTPKFQYKPPKKK